VSGLVDGTDLEFPVVHEVEKECAARVADRVDTIPLSMRSTRVLSGIAGTSPTDTACRYWRDLGCGIIMLCDLGNGRTASGVERLGELNLTAPDRAVNPLEFGQDRRARHEGGENSVCLRLVAR
jgi:hypothetical protein